MSEHPATVLCIDDEAMIRLTIGDYLEDSGYVVYQAENGKTGLEIFQKKQPDIVLVDLRMPEIDGLEVLTHVTQESPEIPIIVVSGTGVMSDVIEALRLGAWDYITKPVGDLGILEHAVEKSLERARLIRENHRYQEHLEEQVHQRTEELRQSEEQYRKLNEELEERVRQRTTELETVNKELKSFAYIVSHDLKAPLRGISQLADWLVTDYAEAFDEQGKEIIELLIGRVKRMDNLIEGILRYSRIGRTVGQEEQIDGNTLIKDVIDIIAPPESIRIRVKNRLPVLVGNRTRIAQVFQNLLENAVKFMDKPRGEVVICCVDEGPSWRFSITDNGPGIETKYYEKIFQIFQTLTPRDVHENTGIGLALVKKIIELYGGQVWLESTMGKGSTFFFTLPKTATF